MLLFCLFSLSLTHSFLNSLCFSFKTTKRYIIILGIDATCLIKINTSVRLIYIVISPATQPFAICLPCLFHFIFAFCLVSLSLSLPPHLKRFLNYEKKNSTLTITRCVTLQPLMNRDETSILCISSNEREEKKQKLKIDTKLLMIMLVGLIQYLLLSLFALKLKNNETVVIQLRCGRQKQ